MKRKNEILRELEGLHTVETVAETLNIKKQSALNLLSRLRKEHHVTKAGRKLYKITMRKQLPRTPGMWDVLNKHSPHMKLNPWYDHQVHGKYNEEDALIDAIKTKSFRIILVSLRLFNHIKDWSRLYSLAKKNDSWRKVGALYDVAKLFFKVRKMPERYRKSIFKSKKYLIKDYITKEKLFLPVEKKWKVYIPFRMGDIRNVKYLT